VVAAAAAVHARTTAGNPLQIEPKQRVAFATGVFAS